MKKMLAFLTFLLITFSTLASAEPALVWTHQGGKGSITLLIGDCQSAKILGLLKDFKVEQSYQAAKIKWDDDNIEGCWTLHPSGDYCIIGEDDNHKHFKTNLFIPTEVK